MRYTIEGFGQEMAVKMNLDCDCLAILRWFVDFQGSNKMEFIIKDDQPYYWVNYSKVINDMPIISDKEDTIYRKFKKLVESRVLNIHTTRKKFSNGIFQTFAYYAFDINYNCLIDNECTELSHPTEAKTNKKSLGKKSELLNSEKNPSNHSEKNPYKINLLTSSYSSINNNNAGEKCKSETVKEKPVVVDSQIKILTEQFKENYKADLDPKRAKTIIQLKGIDHAIDCVSIYKDYIQGRVIRNVGGDFYKFVTEGYTKPVSVNNTATTTPTYANFEQREYTDDEFEKFYANVKKSNSAENEKPKPAKEKVPEEKTFEQRVYEDDVYESFYANQRS